MGLLMARCPNCNGNLEVDSSKEAAICPFCNTPFIVEKAINQYITNNYIQGESIADKQKNAIILLKQGNIDIAKPIIDELIKSNPTDYMNWYCLYYYECKKSGDTLNNYIDQAIAVAPDAIKSILNNIKALAGECRKVFPAYNKLKPIEKRKEDIQRPKGASTALWVFAILIIPFAIFFIYFGFVELFDYGKEIGLIILAISGAVTIPLAVLLMVLAIKKEIKAKKTYLKECENAQYEYERALEVYNYDLDKYNKDFKEFTHKKNENSIKLVNLIENFFDTAKGLE